jgi:hypothetical protein
VGILPQNVEIVKRSGLIMQIHMKKLVEVTKDIDGFKENNGTLSIICIKGEESYGVRRNRGKGILQEVYS